MVGMFMDVYGDEEIPTLNICYTARVVGGSAQAASDATELEWFPLDDLPGEIAFNWERGALENLRREIGD
jgi:hypothetical protein